MENEKRKGKKIKRKEEEGDGKKKKKKKEEGETKTLNQIYVLLYKGRCSETQLKRERKIKRNKKKK